MRGAARLAPPFWPLAATLIGGLRPGSLRVHGPCKETTHGSRLGFPGRRLPRGPAASGNVARGLHVPPAERRKKGEPPASGTTLPRLLDRLLSRFARLRAEERLDRLTGPSHLGDFDQEDPSSVRRWATKMDLETGSAIESSLPPRCGSGPGRGTPGRAGHRSTHLPIGPCVPRLDPALAGPERYRSPRPSPPPRRG